LEAGVDGIINMLQNVVMTPGESSLIKGNIAMVKYVMERCPVLTKITFIIHCFAPTFQIDLIVECVT
jgi:hypothetical protein